MGKLIAFYHPDRKPTQPKPPLVESLLAEPMDDVASLIQRVLSESDRIEDILILVKDKDGVLGMIGTPDGPGESILFMRMVEANIVAAQGLEPPWGFPC